jgi:DNA-binding HxlR family transcriptional regulator
MERKSLAHLQCPIARSVDRVGEWWSILILRDASQGLTRFDQFQKSLGIGSNILTRRLQALVEDGMLERRRYSERPPRDEYLLTERGRDFQPVLWALVALLVDRASLRPLTQGVFRTAAGPAANEGIRRRYNEKTRSEA